MKIEIIERPELKAAVLRIPRDGKRVREAWKEISVLLEGNPAVTDREHGYVFVPEWQWATEVTTLWVGMTVDRLDGLPAGVETITIPPKRFAKLIVQGDRSQMEAAYGSLAQWFRDSSYDRDISEGSFSYEKNPLQPVNPFDIPADVIDHFDYEIYAPLHAEGKTSLLPPGYPEIIGVEVRRGSAGRRLVGLEMDVNQKGINPAVAIPHFWQEVMPRLSETKDRKKPYATIGLYLYEPPFGPGQNFRYLAGVEIKPDSKEPITEGMVERTIPDHDSVVITYRGKASGFGRVWDYFHGYWMPRQADYDAIDDYEYELHDHRFVGADDEASVFELHFPVRKRIRDARLTEKIVVDEKGGHALQDLRGEHIRMVSFQGAKLYGMDMRDTQLKHVNFVHASLEHIYFAGVHVRSIQMGGTLFEDIRRPDAAESRLEGETGTKGWVNVEPVVFRDSDLSTAVFENCDLSDVNITGCKLEGLRIDGIPIAELLDLYRKTS
jgi:predicted transcriptional regulator YdeE